MPVQSTPYSNRVHARIYCAGQAAHRLGTERDACPYQPGAMMPPGKWHLGTGTRGFQRAWLRGWDDAKAAKEQQSCNCQKC